MMKLKIFTTALLLAGCQSNDGLAKSVGTSCDIEALSGVKPIVYVEPKYPKKAVESRITGSCTVRFDIKDTKTTNIKVLSCEPQGWFEASVAKAVSRWWFRVGGSTTKSAKGLEVKCHYRAE